MNEALQHIRDKEDSIRAEADKAYEQWAGALQKFGHRDDYWKRVLDIAADFIEQYGPYGRGVINNRIEALEAEWKRLHPPKNEMMEEVFGNGQI